MVVDQQTKNKVAKKNFITLAVAVLGVLLLIVLFRGPSKPAPAAVAAEVPTDVQVQLLKQAPLVLPVISDGTVTSRRSVDVVAQVTGRIVSSSEHFVNGGVVESGATLVQIEQADYRFALAAAEADLARAAETLASERGLVRQARREWRELGNAEANDLFLRKPQLTAAEAAYRAAEAARDQAKLNLERTTITAPFDAIITRVNADAGQFVTQGVAVAQIAALDRAEIRIPLTDRQLALLPALPSGGSNKTLEATVVAIFAGKQWRWPARIVRKEAQMNPQSRVLYAVAEIASPFLVKEGQERPPLYLGQYVSVELSSRPLGDVFSVPRAAIIDQQSVWVVDDTHHLHRRAVDIVYSDGQSAVIRGDLNAGQRIVAVPLSVLAEGMRVNPVDVTGGAL